MKSLIRHTVRLLAFLSLAASAAESLGELRNRAAAGDVRAQLELANSYLEEPNLELARKWFSAASAQGSAEADWMLALSFLLKEKNGEAAMEFLKRAASRGHRDAAIMGTVVTEKDNPEVGLKEDLPAARAFLEVAARAGNLHSQVQLGVWCYQGVGGPKNERDAAKWIRQAAERASKEAQFFLGMFYRDGVGVIRDPIEAHTWLNVASAFGHEQAKTLLNSVERNMSKAQVETATLLAKERFSRLEKLKEPSGDSATKTSLELLKQ